jgi:hypothetical protein
MNPKIFEPHMQEMFKAQTNVTFIISLVNCSIVAANAGAFISMLIICITSALFDRQPTILSVPIKCKILNYASGNGKINI